MVDTACWCESSSCCIRSCSLEMYASSTCCFSSLCRSVPGEDNLTEETPENKLASDVTLAASTKTPMSKFINYIEENRREGLLLCQLVSFANGQGQLYWQRKNECEAGYAGSRVANQEAEDCKYSIHPDDAYPTRADLFRRIQVQCWKTVLCYECVNDCRPRVKCHDLNYCLTLHKQALAQRLW